MGMTSLDFGVTARSLAGAARLRGLVVPVFASPPSRPDLDRSIRRRNGSPVVSVRLRGRPATAVLADMVEGVVVASELSGARADLARSALWLALDADPAVESRRDAEGDSRREPARDRELPRARRATGEEVSKMAA